MMRILTLDSIDLNMCPLVHIKIFLKFKTFHTAAKITNPLFFLCVRVRMSF